VLELYLLIAMKRLEEKERDKYNFQMVFAGPHELSCGVNVSAMFHNALCSQQRRASRSC
jgi:hypothetical protein